MTENEETYQIVENVIATWDAKAPSIDDLAKAADVLRCYEGDQWEVQALINVVTHLEKQIESKRHRALLNQVKREYAAEHGIKVSQVRYVKKAVA